MTLIFLLYLLILTVSAVGPEYYVSIDTVNGYPTGSLPSIITSPVELTGKFSAKNAAGHENQYGVIIYWGDGTYTRWHWTDPGNASPYLDWNPLNPNAKDFSGTYNTNPDGAPGKEHNYASEGTYTITVKFFHQQEPGKDSEVATFSITVHLVVPAISITKSGPAYAHEGDAITYAYTVSNTGNCPLSDVSVVDDLGITIDYISGDENGNNLLDLTENWIFHATYTVPTPSGDITNIATATGKASGRTVSDSASWTVSILHPGIKVTKSADKTVAYKGDTITYTIKITNTGDCALYDVELVDTLLGTIWTGVLDVGESRTFTPTYTVKAGDPDPLVNAATASGEDSLGLEVTDYATAQVDLISKKYKLTVHTAGLGTHITNVYDGSNVLGTATDAAPYEGWFDEGSEINLDVDSPVTDSLTRFVFTQWSGDSTGTARPIIMVMDSDKSITANYKTQYYLTVNTNPAEVLTLNPATVSGGGWYDGGDTATVDAIQNVDKAAGQSRYDFRSWTGASPTGEGNKATVIMDAPKTATANYQLQYRVTFYTNPPSGTITVDGMIKNNSESEFYDEGASLTVAASAPADYGFSSWTVTGGVTVADYSMQTTSMNIGGAGSLTANFIVNTVSIIITSNPVTGVGFVKVDGVSYATPVIFSWLIGSTHELEAISIVPGPTGTRYVWTGWSDGGAQSHVYTVPSVSETLTAYFSVQHYLTVISPHDTPGGSGWYDEGATAYATLETGTVMENGVQYVFTGWSGDASGTGLISNPIIMSGPKTAVANWMAEFYTVTFDKSPRQGIIRVDDTVYTSLPVVLHWAPGSSHEVVVPEIEEAGGTRYVFREWSDGSMQASRTIVADTPGAVYIAYYNVQYRLTVYSDYGVTTGSGWYDEGAEAVFSVSPTVVRDESEGIEYSFKGWVGSGAGAYYTGPDNPARVVMTGPVEETAQWEPSMYYLKVVSEYGDPYGSGWYPPNSEARFGVNTPVSHGNGTLRVFLNWSGDISLWEPEGTLLMVKPYTVIAYWDTQYLVVYNTTAPNGVLLSIPRVPQTLPPGFNVYATYYSAGSSVEVGPAPETVYGAEDTRYCFEGWAIDGKHATSNVNLAFTVDKPLNISVAYGTEILLTVNMVGVSQPYTARLTVEKSPAYIFDITPASPFREWVRKDTAVTLTVSSPNKIGHGEWAVFREWSGDAQGFQRTVSLKVSGPTTVNAVFFAVNPVAQSIPYSLLTGIVSIVLSRLIRRRREEEPRERWRYSPTLGIMSLVAVLAVAAVVSSSVAMGYGINVGELPDFTNWAVVFTAIEAVVFLAGTLLATRLAYLRKVEIPAIYPNPYGV
ncbi:MAG: hypothetical protein QW334_00710 [Thermofilum sp.]